MLKKLRNLIRERDVGLRTNLSEDFINELTIKLNHAFPHLHIRDADLAPIISYFGTILTSIKGRACNDVDDYIVNYFMRKASSVKNSGKDDKYAQVEIGVLFGVGTVWMLKALQDCASEHQIISIDPLNGYYLSDNKEYSSVVDPCSKIPINPATVRNNISACGFNDQLVTLITESSQSDNVYNKIKDFKIASIWIDGDHSYEGLKNDFEKFFPLVVKGGYILIDNYKDCHWKNSAWPDVTRFIECELVPQNDKFKTILIHNRCFLLEKK